MERILRTLFSNLARLVWHCYYETDRVLTTRTRIRTWIDARQRVVRKADVLGVHEFHDYLTASASHRERTHTFYSSWTSSNLNMACLAYGRG